MPIRASNEIKIGWWIRYMKSEFLPNGKSGLATSGASFGRFEGLWPSA